MPDFHRKEMSGDDGQRLAPVDRVTKPTDFRFRLKLDDGDDIVIRSIQPADAGIEQEFVRTLSAHSRFLRFFTPLKELSPDTLKTFTHNSYPSDMALIATFPTDGKETQIGVARFAPGSRDGWAEFAIAVADAWQGKGIATQLLRHLFDIAMDTELEGIEGIVLWENRSMLELAKQLGFSIEKNKNDPSLASIRKSFRRGATFE